MNYKLSYLTPLSNFRWLDISVVDIFLTYLLLYKEILREKGQNVLPREKLDKT